MDSHADQFQLLICSKERFGEQQIMSYTLENSQVNYATIKKYLIFLRHYLRIWDFFLLIF
jgi:hypothetical protein